MYILVRSFTFYAALGSVTDCFYPISVVTVKPIPQQITQLWRDAISYAKANLMTHPEALEAMVVAPHSPAVQGKGKRRALEAAPIDPPPPPSTQPRKRSRDSVEDDDAGSKGN